MSGYYLHPGTSSVWWLPQRPTSFAIGALTAASVDITEDLANVAGFALAAQTRTVAPINRTVSRTVVASLTPTRHRLTFWDHPGTQVRPLFENRHSAGAIIIARHSTELTVTTDLDYWPVQIADIADAHPSNAAASFAVTLVSDEPPTLDTRPLAIPFP